MLHLLTDKVALLYCNKATRRNVLLMGRKPMKIAKC